MTFEQLQRLIRQVDPSAFLVRPPLLRRVIKLHREISSIGLQVPHRKTYCLERDTFLQLADRVDLGVPETETLPPVLILLACPDVWLTTHSDAQALSRFWRLLFHARIDWKFQQEIAAQRLTETQIRASVHRLGTTVFAEASQVLRQENFLLPPAGLIECWTEFVAVYLELKYFAPLLLPRYFPGIENTDAVESLLAEWIDAPKLFNETRLPNAPDPLSEGLASSVEDVADDREDDAELVKFLAPERCRRLLARAERVSAKGNVARAALLRSRATQFASPEQIESVQTDAIAELHKLVARLQVALDLHAHEADEWRATLPTLLAPAIRGVWPPSARLLFDLQKVCSDSERELYAVDLVEFFVSLGKKPVKRALPLQADVLLVKHLRNAARRLRRANIDDESRRRLAVLLRSAIHHCEKNLHAKLSPRLVNALEAVGFCPVNYPEEIARKKIVEELIDRVIERGFLNLGDVRDALARNQLKLPDLDGPGTLLLGDPLIRLNRRLALDLDGVYHRGEIYLRWLQRLSSLFFGTMVGRWLTLYLLLPFGGAYGVLVTILEFVHLTETALRIEKTHLHDDVELGIVGVLGIWMLFILHLPRFRQMTWQGLKQLWSVSRGVVWDLPLAVIRLPLLRRLFSIKPLAWFRRYLLRPLLAGGATALACRLQRADLVFTAASAGGTMLLCLALFNSRAARRAEEEATDWLARNWYWVRVDLVPGLFTLILQLFRDALDRLERLIYAVDEWLRFRSGDSRLSLIVKPIVGLFWFWVTYLIRMVVNVFIEPTLNPIKHFPAVTVTGKLIAPLCLPAAAVSAGFAGGPIAVNLAPEIGLAAANTVAAGVLLLLPGLGGFLVWELKENWKLYRANRATHLRPVMIGSHGERMRALLKPGFHSGTLPKIYIKIRKASRRHNGRALYRQQEALLHVKEAIRHFVERDLIMVLEGSKTWGGPGLHVGAVPLGCNRVVVEICCPELGEQPVVLAFEHHAGWLLAEVARSGWLPRLSSPQRQIFATALAGIFARAGADLVRPQLEQALPHADDEPLPPYQLIEPGVLLYPKQNFDKGQLLVLDGDQEISAEWASLPWVQLDPKTVQFSESPISWEDWVQTWQSDQQGELVGLPLLAKVPILPNLDLTAVRATEASARLNGGNGERP